jgi:hypothetical protein
MAIQISIPYLATPLQNILAEVMAAEPNNKPAMSLIVLGKEVAKRLQGVATTIIKLENDGWTLSHFGHASFARHADINSESQVIDRLRAIGIDPGSINIGWSRDESV